MDDAERFVVVMVVIAFSAIVGAVSYQIGVDKGAASVRLEAVKVNQAHWGAGTNGESIFVWGGSLTNK